MSSFSSNVTSKQYKTISQATIEMVQGDDEILDTYLELKNPSTGNFDPYDLTGVTEITFTIIDKQSVDAEGDPTVHYVGTITNTEIVVQSEPDGYITLEPPTAKTSLIPVGTHYYDIQITTSTGKLRTAVIGDCDVALQATKT